MANGTIGKLLALYIIFFDKLQAKRRLIFGRVVLEVVNLFPRSDELFGGTVAFKTPSHLQRLCAPCQRHDVHIPVADLTGNALCNVYAMIEIDEVWKVVHTDPFESRTRLITCPDWLKHRGICPNLGVTRHAGVSWRNPGEGRFLN